MTDYRRRFDPPSQGEMDYIPDPLGRLGMGTYEEQQPRFADPGWEQARQDWMQGASLYDILGVDPFALHQSVGREQPNRRADVFKLQALLHKEGHLDSEVTGGPTGYWGGRDDAALRSFQKENGLTVDGYAAPDGESINTLRGFYISAKPKQYAQAGQPKAAVTSQSKMPNTAADDWQDPWPDSPIPPTSAASCSRRKVAVRPITAMTPRMTAPMAAIRCAGRH